MLIQVKDAPALEVFGRLSRAGCADLLTQTFSALVEQSFETHPMRRVTDREVERRGDLLARWLRKLCDGERYPVDRALHTLRAALRAELDGEKFQPPSMAEQTLIRLDDRIEPYAAQIRARLKESDLAR